jgi:acetyl esterase/lipase
MTAYLQATRLSRSGWLNISLATSLLLIGLCRGGMAYEPLVVPIWSAEIPGPGLTPGLEEKVVPPADVIQRTTDISIPKLVVYKPVGAPSKAAVIVVPGGGFRYLTTDLEGSEACEWLAKRGVLACLLKHRCPTHEEAVPAAGPTVDAIEAIRLVRFRASEWNIEPAAVGFLGFSAGGQVALRATLATSASPDNAGDLAARPDFVMLAYPWGLADPATKTLRPEFELRAGLPPFFIAQAADDGASLPQGSLGLFASALNQKVPAELHVYATGGHGYGIRPSKAPSTTDWTKRAEDWLASRGLIVPPAEIGTGK